MENYRLARPFAALLAIAGLWGLVGLYVNSEQHGNDPRPATRVRELVTRLDGDRCIVTVWASAAFRAGGRFTALLDSGDNDELSLTRADAATAGVDVGSLWFIFPYHSVSGRGFMAHTTLRQLQIGGAVLRDVRASVISETAGNGMSLVGLPLLKRLNFSVRGDSCVVSW
jgi:clan AA aspartic protease (TIGR02281 family)